MSETIAANANHSFLMYKGKPLVRSGNTIYYGSMKDPYVVMLQILTSTQDDRLEIAFAQKVTIQLMPTDQEQLAREGIIKKGEKEDLYNALDLASIWLERALKEHDTK